ncbi:MAG: hypothetical protein JXB05_13600 [Myxococcaceae bacterium]|nr:hypothetical protein [Myxococcaceae bacterium]
MDSSSLFRFLNIRPPQRRNLGEGRRDLFDPYDGSRFQTVLSGRLQEAIAGNDFQQARALAEAFIAGNSEEGSRFIRDWSDLPEPFATFDQLLAGSALNEGPEAIRKHAVQIFDASPLPVLITRPDYVTTRKNLADSLCSAFFAKTPSLPSLAHLVRGLRLCALLQRLAPDNTELQTASDIRWMLAARVLIPFATYPLVRSPLAGTMQAMGLGERANVGDVRPTYVAPAGIGDLLIVRQTLRRYEFGEIAHVENALKGEFKERSHRRTETTEVTTFEETETTHEAVRDLQSTDRFELKTEVSRTIQEDLRAQAGLTVTATYGAVTATATGSFGYDRAIEEASRTASSYARDVVARSATRIQQRTLERRTTRNVLEVEELAKHGIDNAKQPTGHVVGFYRWLDKVYEAQVVNYGRRLMIEFMVPEPAAYYRKLEQTRLTQTVSLTRPEEPKVKTPNELVDLHPGLITWPGILQLAATYKATGLTPPPPPEIRLGVSLEVPHTDKSYDDPAPREAGPPIRWLAALGGTKISSEIKIPPGYVAKTADWSGGQMPYIRKSPVQGGGTPGSGALEDPTMVSIGGQTGGLNGSVNVDGFRDVLPVAVVTGAAGLVVTVNVLCHRQDSLVEAWQIKTYEAIIAAYQQRLAEYEDAVRTATFEREGQIAGRNPLENREIERVELKRAATSMLTQQHFATLGALDDAAEKDKSLYRPINFSKAYEQGEIVKYFEQAFEWHNLTYVFYPYFWGRRDDWPAVLGQQSTDPLFLRFLEAGFARLQVPVRPGHEEMVLFFLSSGKLWREAEDAPVVMPYVSMAEEIRNQSGDDFTIGSGKLTVPANSPTATGTGTQFGADDEDREIRIAGKVHRIATVLSATTIVLARPLGAQAVTNAPYSLGPKLVGPSWEVRLPTSLVAIDSPEISLPKVAEQP